jgi:hypothetical protein
VRVCALTGGQMRSFVQCAVVLFVSIDSDDQLVSIWRMIAELDAAMEKNEFSLEDITTLANNIRLVHNVSSFHFLFDVIYLFTRFCN